MDHLYRAVPSDVDDGLSEFGVCLVIIEELDGPAAAAQVSMSPSIECKESCERPFE
jgi:hypothetical protein